MLTILDECQLELVEFQLGDLSKGLLERLPREAKRATGNEHPSLLFGATLGATDLADASVLPPSEDSLPAVARAAAEIARLSVPPDLLRQIVILPELWFGR